MNGHETKNISDEPQVLHGKRKVICINKLMHQSYPEFEVMYVRHAFWRHAPAVTRNTLGRVRNRSVFCSNCI